MIGQGVEFSGALNWGAAKCPEPVEYDGHIYLFGRNTQSGEPGTNIVCRRWVIEDIKAPPQHHSWGEIFAPTGVPTHTVTITEVAATRDYANANIAHVVFCALGSATYYAQLNMATGVWSARETVATTTQMSTSGIGIFCASNGSVILYAQGPTVRVSGNDRQRIGAWRRNSGTWTYVIQPVPLAGADYFLRRASHDATDDSIYIQSSYTGELSWRVTLSGSTLLWTQITALTYHGGGTPVLGNDRQVVYINSNPWFIEAQQGGSDPACGYRQLNGAGRHEMAGAGVIVRPGGIIVLGVLHDPTESDPFHLIEFARYGPLTSTRGYVTATSTGYSATLTDIPGTYQNFSAPFNVDTSNNSLVNRKGFAKRLSHGDGFYIALTSQRGTSRMLYVFYAPPEGQVELDADLLSTTSTMLGSLQVGGVFLSGQPVSAPSEMEGHALAGTFAPALAGLAYGVSAVPRGALERFLIRADIDGQNVPLVSLTIRRALQADGAVGLDAVELGIPYTPALLAAMRAAQGQQIAIRAIHESPNGETAIRTLGTYPIQQVRRIGGSGRIAVFGALPATYVIDDTPVQIRKVIFENANQLRAPIDYQLYPGQTVIGTAGAMRAQVVTLYMDAETRLSNMEISNYGPS